MRLAEFADLRGLVVAAALAEDAASRSVLLDQRVDLGNQPLGGEARDVAHSRAEQHLEVLVAERLEAAPEVAREQEVVIVERVLRQRHAHQQVERLDARHVVPQPQEDVVGLVGLAAAAGLQEGLLVRLDALRGDDLAGAVIGQIGRAACVGAAGVERARTPAG